MWNKHKTKVWEMVAKATLFRTKKSKHLKPKSSVKHHTCKNNWKVPLTGFLITPLQIRNTKAQPMKENCINIVAASIGKGKGQISSITLAASSTLLLSPFTKIDVGHCLENTLDWCRGDYGQRISFCTFSDLNIERLCAILLALIQLYEHV